MTENRVDTVLSSLAIFSVSVIVNRIKIKPEIVMIFCSVLIQFFSFHSSFQFPFFSEVFFTNQNIISLPYLLLWLLVVVWYFHYKSFSLRYVYTTYTHTILLILYDDDKLYVHGRLTRTLSERRYLYQHGDKINVVLIGSDLLRLCITSIHITWYNNFGVKIFVVFFEYFVCEVRCKFCVLAGRR